MQNSLLPCSIASGIDAMLLSNSCTIKYSHIATYIQGTLTLSIMSDSLHKEDGNVQCSWLYRAPVLIVIRV